MRVLCYGDSSWDNNAVIERELSAFSAGTVVIHGDYIGADKMCGQVAKSLGFEVNAVPVVRGLIGPPRNQYMLTHGKPDVVLIFQDGIPRKQGMHHLITIARDAGIPTRIITS